MVYYPRLVTAVSQRYEGVWSAMKMEESKIVVKSPAIGSFSFFSESFVKVAILVENQIPFSKLWFSTKEE